MSIDHREREQLSAYLDGELGDAERTVLEAHISTCEQCAEALAALRATTTDLRLLAEASPPQQDSWALRSAIARARREQQRGPRWGRVAMASSASAAVLALVVGSVVLLGGNGGGDGGQRALGPGSAADALLESAPTGVGIEVLDTSFDQQAARDLIVGTSTAASSGGGSSALSSGRDDGTEADAPAPGDSAKFAAEPHAARIASCENELFGDERQVERTPQRYIAARYNDVAAYFLLYHLPSEDGYELWVVARSDCSNVLLFEQRAA